MPFRCRLIIIQEGVEIKKISCAYLLQDVLWDQPRRREFRIIGKSTSDLSLLPKPESQPSKSNVCHLARCV